VTLPLWVKLAVSFLLVLFSALPLYSCAKLHSRTEVWAERVLLASFVGIMLSALVGVWG
jgi:hypothetical protein